MFKQTLAALFFCTCLGVAACTDASADSLASGGDDARPPGSTPGGGGTVASDSEDRSRVGTGIPDLGSGGTDGLEPGGGAPSDPPEPVPEPMTMLLFGTGLAGIALHFRRRRRADGDGEDNEAAPA